MQIDFHFYAVYSLARAAGMNPDDAFVAAYASQMVDDAEYEHPLDFENGGRFRQLLTAHRIWDPGSVSKETCYRIWIPFHFLPGGSGLDFYEKMAVKPDGQPAKRVLDSMLAAELKPYALHGLGIFLHVLADAFSHQNFLGLRHESNDVRSLDIISDDPDWKEWAWEQVEYFPVSLGHLQAGYLPDQPYARWNYTDAAGLPRKIDNRERTLAAAQALYLTLIKFLKAFPVFAERSFSSWNTIESSLLELFSHDAELGGRVDKWKEAVSRSRPDSLGFSAEAADLNVVYEPDDRRWFYEAVEVVRGSGEDRDLYRRRPGFEVSHWKLFHDAAAYHQFLVLRETLPDFGIYCG